MECEVSSMIETTPVEEQQQYSQPFLNTKIINLFVTFGFPKTPVSSS